MKIYIRKIECLYDEFGEWMENDGRNLYDFSMPKFSCIEDIKRAIVSRLRDWYLYPLEIAAGKYRWAAYGDDLEIVANDNDEPLFHITMTEEE